MGKAYSIDLRNKVIQMVVEHQITISQVARMMQISRKTIYSWLKPGISRARGRPPKITDLSLIWDCLRRNPDITAEQMARKFNLSRQTVYSYLRKVEVMYRKKVIGKKVGALAL